MPYSARALGQEGLRLRSRRVRSTRSQRLSVARTLAIGLAVSLVGFVGASVVASNVVSELPLPSLVIPGWMPGPPDAPSNTASTPPALDSDDRQYLNTLLPIHSQLMRVVLRTGVAAASFDASDAHGRAVTRGQLDDSLTSYRRIEEQVLALQPPPDLRDSHASYVAAVRMFERSTAEMLKVYDDGNVDHISNGAPLSLEGMARMQVLSDRFWPR